jgi:hypothetical protein
VALLDNWMKVELDKYKENQALTSILETKKSSKASILIAGSKDHVTPKYLEEEKPIMNSITTFSQKNLNQYKGIGSNRDNFSTAQSYLTKVNNPQRFNAMMKSTQEM